MARSRNIKPGFFLNEDLAECDPLARILFAGLWCLADREGRLEDRPRWIKAQALPYDNCDVDALLQQLAARGFIFRYQVDGRRLLWVIRFLEHQSPHGNEKPSELPAPPGTHEISGVLKKNSPDSLFSDSGNLDPDSLVSGRPAEQKKTATNTENRSADSRTPSDLRPSDTAPTSADTPPQVRNGRGPPDPLFEAIVAVTGADRVVSRAHIGRVLKELRAADPPYTPEEVCRWGELVTGNRSWDGGPPPLGLLSKDIGRVRHPASAPPKKGTRHDRRRSFRYRANDDPNLEQGNGSPEVNGAAAHRPG
jgi:hypothetical protein